MSALPASPEGKQFAYAKIDMADILNQRPDLRLVKLSLEQAVGITLWNLERLSDSQIAGIQSAVDDHNHAAEHLSDQTQDA